SLGVHVRNHENDAVARVGDDGRDQTGGVEARRKDNTLFKRGLVGRRLQEFDACHTSPFHGAGSGAAQPLLLSRSIAMNRTCSSGWSRKAPVNVDVRVVEPCLRMPRMAMHICSASIMTATPRGFSTSWITPAICAVMASCVCRRCA